jgi:5-methylcytosine-specific restriction endonuclease McrA
VSVDALLWTRQYRALRLWILDRDRNVCQIRGPRCTTWATEVDHIIDRADGGPVFDPANLRAACKQCNGWRAALRTNARRYHTTVARYETRL